MSSDQQATIDRLADFAVRHRGLACLGYTHLQPAQPTTVGKRATLWCYDLVLDLEEIEKDDRRGVNHTRRVGRSAGGCDRPPARRPFLGERACW